MKFQKNFQRIVLISLLSSFSIATGFGQAAIIVLILGDKVATENFHLSIDGALNFASLSGLENGKTLIGANFGLGTHIKLGEKWHLKPEFKPLSQKGLSDVNPLVDLSGTIVPESTKIRLNYLDIPVLMQYNITDALFVSAGPQISFLLSGKQLSEGTFDGNDITLRLDTKSLFNTVDFSLPVEVGYSFTLSRKGNRLDINAFARYSYGFAEVMKDPANGSARNSNFQFGLSLPFIKVPEQI
jgi:hypothetical protein